MLVELLYSSSEEISIRMGLMIVWIIHLWWKSPPLSLTPIYTPLAAYLRTIRQTSSPFLGELISINFNSCNAGLKCGVRRSKLKRPRTAKVQLIFGMEKKERMKSEGEKNLWMSKMIETSKDVYLMVVWFWFYFSFQLSPFSIRQPDLTMMLIHRAG